MQCLGFPGGSVVKFHLQCRRPGFVPWVVKIPWRRKWQPTPILLSGKSHGQRSLRATVDGVAELGMTEWPAHTHAGELNAFTPVQPLSRVRLCNPMTRSLPCFPVHHPTQFSQTLVHRVGDAIQSSRPLSSPSPPAFNLSQHQGLFQWVSSSHQVAKVLEFQHQSFQWIFRIDFL